MNQPLGFLRSLIIVRGKVFQNLFQHPSDIEMAWFGNSKGVLIRRSGIAIASQLRAGSHFDISISRHTQTYYDVDN